MTALSAEQFREHVRETHPVPAHPADVLAKLRGASAHPEGVVPDPLAAPGGPAEEWARRDRETENRRRLKVLLAGNKLHAGLAVAALEHLARAGAPEPPAEAVAAWVDRAGRWIEATVEAQARRWGEAAQSGDAGPSGPDRALALSGYHRYELARALVSALQRRPGLPDRTGPEEMAGYLAAPAAGLPPEPAPPGWASAGAEADRALAWSRALARVAEVALDHDFNRDLAVLLADARAAIETETARGRETLTAGIELNDGAADMVYLHALNTASRLYAATLKSVYQESVRQIRAHQQYIERDDAAAADRCAVAYQEKRLGYAGVLHHFELVMTAYRRQQVDALSALRPQAPNNPPASKSDDGRCAPATRRAQGPITP